MTVEPLLFAPDGFQGQIESCDNENYGPKILNGWVTEDGCIFYCEKPPKFHPMTGEPLKVLEEEDAFHGI
jgi:hypothetical protein